MRGLVKYQTKSDSILISGTQVSQSDFLRETALLRELRPDCKKPVLHFSLSQPPGESLPNEKWAEVADRFLEKMGLENNSHFIVRHTDAPHDHIHIAVNKIRDDGKLWDTQKSALRAMEICTEIEKEFKLTVTKTLSQSRAEKKEKSLSTGAIRQFERTGQLPNKTKDRIQKRIRDERARKNNATRQNSNEHDGRLVECPSSNQDGNREIERNHTNSVGTNQEIGKPIGAFGEQAINIEKPKPVQINCIAGECKWKANRAHAPNLRDENFKWIFQSKPVEDFNNRKIFDIYRPPANDPLYRYRPDEQKIELLAGPTHKSVNDMLRLADQRFTQPMLITGSPEFQQIAVEEAADLKIDIIVSDPIAQAQQQKIANEKIAAERAAAEKAEVEKTAAKKELLEKSISAKAVDIDEPEVEEKLGMGM